MIARYGITLLQSYRITQHKVYLDRVSTNASFLLDHAMARSLFPLPLHIRALRKPPRGCARLGNLGMVQAPALTLFARLYAATGDERWGPPSPPFDSGGVQGGLG